MFDLTIRTIDGENHRFHLPERIFVRTLKDQIFRSLDIPINQQRLIYRGEILTDERVLLGAEMHGHVVHLVYDRSSTSRIHPGAGDVSPRSSSERPAFQNRRRRLNADYYVIPGSGDPGVIVPRYAALGQLRPQVRILRHGTHIPLHPVHLTHQGATNAPLSSGWRVTQFVPHPALGQQAVPSNAAVIYASPLRTLSVGPTTLGGAENMDETQLVMPSTTTAATTTNLSSVTVDTHQRVERIYDQRVLRQMNDLREFIQRGMNHMYHFTRRNHEPLAPFTTASVENLISLYRNVQQLTIDLTSAMSRYMSLLSASSERLRPDDYSFMESVPPLMDAISRLIAFLGHFQLSTANRSVFFTSRNEGSMRATEHGPPLLDGTNIESSVAADSIRGAIGPLIDFIQQGLQSSTSSTSVLLR
ncbi:hypothetical protein ACOME3_009347 [Neoechinorhynchus agilis]